MIKKLIFCISLGLVVLTGSFCVADELDDTFDFDEFAIADGGDTDINIEPVTFNDGDGAVDVRQFDIAGAMLGMSYEEINNLFFENGSLYAPRLNNSVVYTINKDWKYNLDYECRQNNIFIPEQVENCIRSLARSRGLLYVSEVHLERAFTGETIDIYFTSNATDNVVWKIVYKNDVNVLEGVDGEKYQNFSNQRDKKRLVFWQSLIDKYGTPNSGDDKWISSENAYDPMMRAYYGQLELLDFGINATDSANNIQASREKFQAKPYAF